MTVDYRVVDSICEFEQAVDLEILIWGLNARDAAPPHLLHVIGVNGGAYIAAFHDTQMVGVAFAFPVWRGNQRILWSYMTGVHPSYQGQNIGLNLKLKQREWALANSYNAIHWTFDPMQRGNANFNIHKLGATSNIYHLNYYGAMNDSINAGLPSDRLEVVWKIREKRSPSGNSKIVEKPDNGVFLLQSNANGTFQDQTPFSDNPMTCFVEIPADLTSLKRHNLDAARSWQLALRQTLQTAFDTGYTITDFENINKRCWYVLSPPVPWYMYVVECADKSLYTGISNDLARRLSQHNKGTGAAYTASRRPVRMLAAWRFTNRSAALKAEAHFKQKTRQSKLEHLRSKLTYYSGTFIEMD